MTEMTTTKHRGRRLAGVLAGALALGVLPLAVPASAAPRVITEATGGCPASEVPDFNFDDVDDGNTHFDAINCIAYYGITLGTGDGSDYSPAASVPRDQMASFIVRLMEYAIDNSVVPIDPLPEFNVASDDNLFPCDVDAGVGSSINPHYANINILAQAEVPVDTDGDGDVDVDDDIVTIVQGGVGGGDVDCYSPTLPVSRAQMASFIHRAELFLDAAITVDVVNAFSDDEGNVHEANINAIAKEDIAAGVTEFTYNPDGDVKRDQMASFLARKLDYLKEEHSMTVPTPFVVASVTPDEVEEGVTETVSATVASNVPFDMVNITISGTTENACTVVLGTQSVSPAAEQVTFNVNLSTAALGGTADETCILEFNVDFEPASANGAMTADDAAVVEINVTAAA